MMDLKERKSKKEAGQDKTGIKENEMMQLRDKKKDSMMNAQN